MIEKPIIVALDHKMDWWDYKAWLNTTLDPNLCRVKIGKSLFTRFGVDAIEEAQLAGYEVFLDLKYHDIPNTVADAVEAAADHGVWMVNIHASGGVRMMQAAVERLASHKHKPLLIAVTCLTSLDQDDLNEMGLMHSPGSFASALIHAAYEAEVDGVVCSPHEISQIRDNPHIDNNFITVVPGVRPVGSDQNDQKRVMTPLEAIQEGASYLVIGRPITANIDPRAALENIAEKIGRCHLL